MIEPTREEIDKLKKDVKRLKKRHDLFGWVVLLMFVAIGLMLIVHDVSAQTITMSNPGSAARDIIVYHANGTMYGFYNDSSVIVTNGSEDYIFTLKPEATNPLTDPMDWLSNQAIPFVQSNVIGIVVLAAIGMWYGFGRR